MGAQCVDQLIREHQTILLRERRSADRKPFVRPVVVTSSRRENDAAQAFSRDISKNGVSLISRVAWEPQTIATLSIHSLQGASVRVMAEVRWCDEYGEGWYVTGWVFMRNR